MRIILACAAGMSTSILAHNIAKVADDRGLEVTVEALSSSALNEAVWRAADVVLVGPQMRFQLDELKETGEKYHVPVEAIPPQNYAMADGQKVLEQADALVNSQAFHKDAGPGFHTK